MKGTDAHPEAVHRLRVSKVREVERRILLRRELKEILATIRRLERELHRLGDRETIPWPGDAR